VASGINTKLNSPKLYDVNVKIKYKFKNNMMNDYSAIKCKRKRWVTNFTYLFQQLSVALQRGTNVVSFQNTFTAG